MATTAEWVQGARVRTLPNSVAPVLVGAGAAAAIDGFNWWQSALALVVALALQVGVNYANDYSDGIRGTDTRRVGPLRLVGSGVATPHEVRNAAFACFAIAGLAGFILVAATQRWWLLSIGVLSIAGAWYYTGGKKPYGYSGWGEAAVFLFFGPVPALGTLYVQTGRLTLAGIAAAIATGAFSAAVLATNNLRDVPTDRVAGKTTLAVRLGEQRTRILYAALVATPFVITIILAFDKPLALLGFLAAPLIVRTVKAVKGTGMALIPVLRDTAMAMLVWSAATAIALAFG